ncbi:urease accessory protein UreH domain-containing protein [Campylobacter jejuni]|uniref:urease accessory protein UreH domain-containing protein n=1 Tax=Campylobacter jejuni TaxID=197 RepID=UPI0011246C22|nr:sulfite exporter TauE/SafE family protein [Campylobacter jejuni]
MSIDFLAIISVAFLSSFGHCYSMCGGFNLLFINLNSKSNNLFLLTFIYNLFRIFAYIVLGIIFGTFGNIWPTALSLAYASYFSFVLILGKTRIFDTAAALAIHQNLYIEKNENFLLLSQDKKIFDIILEFLKNN